MAVVTRQVVVPNQQGLHARPIAQICKLANEHEATLVVGLDGLEVDGSLVLEMLMLCAPMGSDLMLRAEGEDAEALVNRVAALIEGGFGEP